MSAGVLTETVIAVPSDRVASYAADPSHAPEWYANIDSVTWQTPPPVAIGSRIGSPPASSAGASPTPTRSSPTSPAGGW